jgi:hypothetical protein
LKLLDMFETPIDWNVADPDRAARALARQREFARRMPKREDADFGRFINSNARAARAKPRAQAKAASFPGASSRPLAQT